MEHLRRHGARADTLQPMFGPAWCQASVNYCAATAGLRGARLPQLMPQLTVDWHAHVDIVWDATTRTYRTGQNTEPADNEIVHGPGGIIPGKEFAIIDWGGFKPPNPDMPHFHIWDKYARGATLRTHNQ